MSEVKKPLTDLEMLESLINICQTAIDKHYSEDLEAMVKEDLQNSLLIDDTDPSDLEDLLEDIETLDYNPQYYQKPKTKPSLTDWYI